MKRLILSLLFALVVMSAGAQTGTVKTFSILGDSYSTFQGHVPEGNAIWYSAVPNGENDVTKVEQTWWYLFGESGKYRMIMNDSYSGSTICNTGYDRADYTDRSFITRMKRLVEGGEAPDILFIFGATNDSWADAPIGELQYGDWTSTDLFRCLPAYCHMLDYLTSVLPQTKIVCVINSELKYEIVDGIMKASDHYGTSYILLKDIEKIWGHPSILGMRQICDQLTDFLD